MPIIEMSIKDSPRGPKTDLVIHGGYSINYNHNLYAACSGFRIDPLATITIEANRVTDITKLKEDICQGKTRPSKAMANSIYGYGGEMFFDEFAFCSPFEIVKVIFNGPATIVFFGDGGKEVIKHDPKSNEPFDPQKAILHAFMKYVSKRESSKTWDNNLKMVDRACR